MNDLVEANSNSSRDYVVDRGDEIFEQEIKAKVQHMDPELHVVIDVDTGEFAIGDDHLKTTHQLLDKNPHARLYHRHIGHRWSFAIGGRPLEPSEVRFRRIR